MKALKFLSFLLITSCFFISCDKEEPQKKDYYILNIIVENGSDFDIDEVQAKFDYYNVQDDAEYTVTIARSEYNGGNIKVLLPKILNEKYLIDITQVYDNKTDTVIDDAGDVEFIKNTLQISDETSKILQFDLFFEAYKQGHYVGRISSAAYLKYVSKSCNVVGEHLYSRFHARMGYGYEIYFVQGWNFLRRISRFDNEKITGELITKCISVDLSELEWKYTENED